MMNDEEKTEEEDEPGLPKRKIFNGARLKKSEKDEIR